MTRRRTFVKNHSSVILNMELADTTARKTVKNYLNGGDAEVLIWERLWAKHKKAATVLEYDLLETPHHCSWHTLSWDSRSAAGRQGQGVARCQEGYCRKSVRGGVSSRAAAPIKRQRLRPTVIRRQAGV